MNHSPLPEESNVLSVVTAVAAAAEGRCSLMTSDFSSHHDLYREPIFRYYLWKCRDPDVAHDLTQETFLRYWLCLQQQKQVLNVRAFLYHIANNLFIDHLRKKKESSLDQLLETGFEPTVDPWHHTYNRLESERVMKHLKKMPNPYKQVLHERFILGFSPAEIASKTGETSNTISVRIYRGIKHLRVQTLSRE
jgi:RNA polymerase sigma-70 factor (ECF subfamily)